MESLVARACLGFTHCRFEESLDRNRRAISLAGRVELPGDESHARFDLVHVLYAMVDLVEAAQHASAILEPEKRTGTTVWQTLAMEANDNVRSAKGDWQGASDFAEQSLAMSPREANLLGCLALLEYQVGNFDAGGTYPEQLLENIQPSPSRLAAFTTNTVPAVVVPLTAFIAGERPGLAADRVLGLLSQIICELDQAAAHFEYSLTFCREAGFRPESAWICCGYADCLLQRNGDGDRIKAMALLDKSLAISSELGMRPLMERVLSRREILKA